MIASLRAACLSAAATLTIFAGTGCAGKSHKKSMVTYFVHGNPLSLVEGTQTAPSFLTPDNYGTFNGFHVSGISAFIEQEPQAAPTTYSQVEQNNSTEETDDSIEKLFEMKKYNFVKKSDTAYVYTPDTVTQDDFTVGFTVVNGKLTVTDISGMPVKEQHYSLKADGKAFSLLVSMDSYASYGRALFVMYFADSSVTQPIERASKDFAFLNDTVKVTWGEDIKIEACGTFDDKTKASIESSITAWLQDPAATAEKRPVTYGGVRTTYPPFSDLDVHCVYLVDTLKLENSTDFYTAGATFPVMNLGTKKLVDSDIMLFTSHATVKAQISSGDPSAVLMHETGHFFGLGHEFKTDPATGKALHPSIMGYSQGTAQITDWDYEAIRDLYGMSLGPAS